MVLSKSETRVVRTLFCHESPTRRIVARESRLSLVKVSSILRALEQRGLVGKDGKTRTTGGRPSHIYRLRESLGYTLGLSLGLEAMQVVATDCAKRLLYQRTEPLTLSPDPLTHAEAIVQSIGTALERAVEGMAQSRPPLGVGLALPGMVDSGRGLWLLGLQLTGITHVRIAELLSRRLGVPVVVEDVARSLAFQQMHLGEGRRLRHFVLLYLGLGMGTGVVIDRRLYRGFHGLAGEVGHVAHPQNRYRCSCGNVGCLETVASTAGMLRVFRDRLGEGVISQLQHFAPASGGEALTLERILEAAKAGDRLARSTLAEIGGFVGDACAILIKLFNPEGLVISGQATMFADFLREGVESATRRGVLPEMLVDFRTVFARYEPTHEAHGAALLAAAHFFERRLRELAGGAP